MSGASFKGNLEILNLSDIFQSLAMNRHSGTLIISDGKREKKIYFAEGEIQLLSSSRRMKLGELLIATGKINEEDLDLALKLQKQNRKKLGEILVEEGFCEEDDIARIVKFQIEEEIYDLFLWRKADFEFIADHLPDDMKRDSSNLMRLQLNTNSLIMEALRRLDEWELVKQAVPSTKEIFVIIEPAKLEAIELPERLRNEIHLIDGKTNVEGLAEKTMVSEFELCKLLADLVHAGAIRALPMEQLVQKAEESYAVNDFQAAGALYARLAELAPGEPKVLIPLAESLRRSGDDRQALAIFEEIARKLDPVRDAERLKRCFETIVALDPDRSDIVRKLEEIEARAQSRRRTGVAMPVAVVVVVALGAAGALFNTQIKRFIAGLQTNTGKLKALEDEKAADGLLEKMSYAQNVTKDYARWHEFGVKIWRDYPGTRAREKVVLPILVRTSPPGYAISVNKLVNGVTTSSEPVVVGEYTTRVDKVQIQVRKLVGGTPPDQTTPPLLERVLDDPMQWPGEILFTIEDRPENSMYPDSPIDVEFARHPGSKTWVAVGRDAAVYQIDEKLQRVSWKDVSVGTFGDVFSPATVIGDKAYVGCSQGGIAVLDLAQRNVQIGSFPSDGSVRGRPLVISRAGRLVFGTTTGVVYGYGLEGGRPKWRVELDGVVHHSGVLGDDEGTTVIFVASDERLRAFDVGSGRAVWKPAIVGAPAGPIARAGDRVFVSNTEGEIVQVSAKTGKVTARSTKDPSGNPVRFVVDESGEAVYLATEDGKVRALDARTLQPLTTWPAEYSPPRVEGRASRGIPEIAWLPNAGTGATTVPGRVFVSFDDSRLFGLDPRSGQLAWQGNLGTERVACPITVHGEVFLVATPTSVHLFRRQ